MEITEVRVKLMSDPDDRLQAFCSITLDDCFVVRDLKIIEGSSGPFVAMPSRKLTTHCPQCKCKNHLRAAYCNQCGIRMKDDLAIKSQEGRAKLYADIAHPINSKCREQIQMRVIDEYNAELDRSAQPDYVSRYDDDYDEPDTAMSVDGSGGAATPSHRHIEPAERQPREPHGKSRQRENKASRERDDNFGEGIF